eukprot:symbB.v1.2.034600.t1/scaffold4499.1/size38882/2
MDQQKDMQDFAYGIRDWFGEEKEVSRRKPPDSKEYSYKDLCAGTGGSNRPTCVDDPLQITVDGFKTAMLGLSDGTSKSSSRRSVEVVLALRSLCVFHGVAFVAALLEIILLAVSIRGGLGLVLMVPKRSSTKK